MRPSCLRPPALAALAGLALAGCAGLGAPITSPRPADPKLVQAQRTHEYPGGPVASERVRGGAKSATGAVRSFATTYINWTATSVAAHMRALAAGSIGQARATAVLAAANTAQDYELRRGGIANSGTVEAIASLAGPGRGSRFVVVTLERTTATATNAYQGLRPAWHVAIATAAQLRDGLWVLSGWQPES